jgi:intron-binding protein aquarius
MYNGLNLVIRRQGKVNNFRSVLETIRGLMAGVGSISRVIPTWMQAALLGHGDPNESSFKSETMKAYSLSTVGVPNPDAFLDYVDTFLEEKHLRASFGEFSKEILVDDRTESSSDASAIRRNYRVRVVDKENGKTTVEAESYPFSTVGNGNPVQFTELQVAAIRSGLSPGLTLIVGPPGTGPYSRLVPSSPCLLGLP